MHRYIHRYLSLLVIITSLHVGCSPEPVVIEDTLSPLIQELKSQDWTSLQKRFESAGDLDQFPIKRALDNGATWINLHQIRLVDDYWIVEVDLKKDEQIQRYTFWVASALLLKNSKDFMLKAGQIKGWKPATIQRQSPIQARVNLPSFFSGATFRGIPYEKPLGFIQTHTLNALVDDRKIELEPFKLIKRPLKKGGCKSIRLRKVKPVLINKLTEECIPILNAYLSPQNQNLAVRLTLDLNLTQAKTRRPPPLLIENMMIAPQFNECTRRSILEWSRLYLEKAQCTLEIPLLFKVYTPSSNTEDE